MKHLFFWAVIYQLFYRICHYIQQWFCLSDWVTTIGIAVFLFLLITWLIHTGYAQAAGLCVGAIPKGLDCFLIGLAFLPVLINLSAVKPVRVSCSMVTLLVCASLTEEILFRGFALKAFCTTGIFRGVIGSAALFALLHGLNLFQNVPLPDVLLQIVFAFFAGICYAALRLRTGSIIFCSLAHILTNVTGLFPDAEAARPLFIIGSGFLALGSLLYFIQFQKHHVRQS